MHLSDPPTLKELEELRFQLFAENEEATKVFITSTEPTRSIDGVLAVIDFEIVLLKLEAEKLK